MGNFVHLHNHTEFSLLDGASRIKKLIAQAKQQNMPAIAITDHGVMYGVIDFYKEAKKQGIKPIIGCEVYISSTSRLDKGVGEKENSYHLILLAENNIGYRNLLKLVSIGHLEGFYYRPRIDKEVLKKYSAGLICLSACIAGEIPRYILEGNLEKAAQTVQEYVDIFGKNNFFLEVQNHGLPEELEVNRHLINLATRFELKRVATNDIHYVKREDSEAQDILLCVQTGKRVADVERMKFPNNEFYLKTYQEMQNLFPDDLEVLETSVEIAKRCQVDIQFGKLLLPEFELPDGQTAEAYLKNLCQKGLQERYLQAGKVEFERLEYELRVIKDMGYESYFLIVWDFINFARQNKILVGPGRGSAAGSIVAYLLGITNIDPLAYDLLFERFLNPERVSMPDIDIDFCYERRQEVFEYIVNKYHSDHVAQIITFGTMAAKGAIRDVGRVLDIAYNDVDKIAKLIPNELGITIDKALQMSKELKEIYHDDMQMRKLLDLARAVEGTPRHASTHAAGLVIAPRNIDEFVPLQYSSEGFVTTQYDKDRSEDIGLLKMDLLGLRTLTVIQDALQMIKKNKGIDLDIDKIPLVDKKTAQLLQSGDTAGVFQMESAGMTQLVKDLAPEGFTDLIPLVALYRPGPLGTGMATDFINARHGKQPIKSIHESVDFIVKDTFGVILYQEQVMQIASAMAGFTLGQADILRRAMGKKKPEELNSLKSTFIQGAVVKGIEAAKATEVFELLEHFAGYGFNKSHSAAYALIAYQTAYLKAHYPAEFMAAMLTSVMGQNDKVGYYIEVCRNLGISVQPPSINNSESGFSVKDNNILFGLAGIKNIGENAVHNILAAREAGAFKNLLDLCERLDPRIVNKRALESLIKCGAFDEFALKRAQLLAVLEQAVDVANKKNKDRLSGQIGLFEEFAEAQHDLNYPNLEELPQEQILALEKEIIGYYVTGHPLDKYREKLASFVEIRKIQEEIFRENQFIEVAGMINTCKRTLTKRGDHMAIASLEDFTGAIEVVVFPKIFDMVNRLIYSGSLVAIKGRIAIQDDTAKIMVTDVSELGRHNNGIVLLIDQEHEQATILEKLKNVLLDSVGKDTVYLHFTASNRKIKCTEQYSVNSSLEFTIKEIEDILGANTIKRL